jgi:hypothetical protein
MGDTSVAGQYFRGGSSEPQSHFDLDDLEIFQLDWLFGFSFTKKPESLISLVSILTPITNFSINQPYQKPSGANAPADSVFYRPRYHRCPRIVSLSP